MPKSDGTLKAREFLFFCEDLALRDLPATFPRPERRVMWTVLQLFYGAPWVHFELQPQVGRGVVELGLHFEGSAEANEAAAALLARDTDAIAAELGPGWELEEWTASWRRLHRTFSFHALRADLGRDVADQLRQALVTLQPVVSEIAGSVRWEPPPKRETPLRERRYRRHARA